MSALSSQGAAVKATHASSVTAEVDVTRRLVEEMLALNVGPHVIEKAQLHLLDYLSCALATRDWPWTKEALAVISRWPVADGCPIVGTDLKASPPDAAFINGLMAAFTSRTDIHPSVSGHPCISMFPTALALSNNRQVSGREFLLAIVAGYEVMGRLGRALVNDHFRSRFRSTSVLGCVSAAFTGARVLGLDVERAINAVALTANTASGLQEWGHSGATEQFYEGANAARAATLASLLAEQGVDGSKTIIEGQSGLFAAFGDRARAPELLKRAVPVWEIELTDIKRVAACTFVQAGVLAAEKLIADHAFDNSDIERVEVETYEAALNCPGVDNADAVDGLLAARMSMQHAVASVLVRRGVSDQNFLDYGNTVVQAVAKRTGLSANRSFTEIFPAHQAATIDVWLRGDRKLSSTVTDVPTFDLGGVMDRFRSVARQVMPDVQVARLEKLCLSCGDIADMRDLLAELPVTRGT